MFLGNALSSASSGLDSISRQLALVSQNIANAGTPNYVRETLPLASAEAGGQTFGVRSGVATRAMDEQLQANLFAAVGSEAGEQVAQSALAQIDQVSGAPGSGQDLSSLFGALRDSFSQLANDPANGTQQRVVVNRAQSLADGLHRLGSAMLNAQQNAQDSLVKAKDAANAALHALGTLSDQIILARSRGQSTADLEDQRDGQMRTLAQLTGARSVPQANGDLLVIAGSAPLPLRASSGPFSIGNATFAPGTPPGSAPGLMLNGTPVTGLGGEMGANLTLRDKTVPGLQSGLDDFAQSMAAGFSSQGLTLFTDASGAVPGVGTVGFSSTIQVSTAVQATPSMVRDGATPSGAAGDTTLINKVLDGVFASGATTLSGQAAALVAGHAQLAAASASRADTDKAVRQGLESKLSASTGVSVDTEMTDMIRLQSAYAANAKVIAAVQDMWTQLLGTVR